jgi:hypothetical protein
MKSNAVLGGEGLHVALSNVAFSFGPNEESNEEF